MKIDSSIIEILACPVCKGDLDELRCAKCGLKFPIVQETPVLINDENSLFRTESFVELANTTYKTPSTWKRRLKYCIPSISLNIRSRQAFEKFFANLGGENPKVLIIGGAVAGAGLEFDKISKGVTFVEGDVAFGERTNLICDAHDLPFKNETFDGVIGQAVLEHVLDPARCAAEIHRVLKRGGLVYAETPFMQQVHAGRYDFTRFTHLGHRHLFRSFEEIDSGPLTGAATVLLWSYCYFLQSFFSSRLLANAAFAVGSLTGFWLKYLDHFLISRPNSYDAASAYYFFGTKSLSEVSGSSIIDGYKGLIQ